jgi:pimeloyl-ACP methyl ester carboxylesterase
MTSNNQSHDRVSQTVTLTDGRTLGFAEYGDLRGKPVFYFGGSGSSRLEAPADESILTDLEIRLITTDRPGHGLSDPQPDRTLLGWPDDIAQLADYLGIDQFYVLGMSAGGPHVLACAHKLPERILAGAIVAGVAPPERPRPYQDLLFPNRVLMFGERHFPPLVYLIRRSMRNMIMGDPDEVGPKIASSFASVDQELLKATGLQERMAFHIQEGYRQGWQGPARDDIILHNTWGFQIEDITARIDIWQGDLDESVPLCHAEYQREHIPNSRYTVWRGEGHLALLTRWREVLATLVE